MYYPLFLQYTAEVPTIFHLEIYDCTNTVWLEKKWGIKVQLLSTDRIPPFISQLMILLFYVTYLYYIRYFSNIKVFFLKIIKNRAASLGFLLIFFRKNNSFIQLNCNEVINRVNNYENYDWYPNTEIRID